MSEAPWHEVGSGEGPPGTLRRVDVGETAVCLARTDDGWLAFDDTCTHEECSLAEGELDGTVVICPCHGSEFDVRTGDVVTPPALDPLPIYEAREDDGTLFVPRGWCGQPWLAISHDEGLTWTRTQVATNGMNTPLEGGFGFVAPGYGQSDYQATVMTDPKGTVVQQDPAANSLDSKGATVTLYVSKGPTQSAVPDVSSFSRTDAIATLRNSGFKVVVEESDVQDPSLDGVVLFQAPQAGSSAEPGATVTITVGHYTAPPAPTTTETVPTDTVATDTTGVDTTLTDTTPVP